MGCGSSTESGQPPSKEPARDLPPPTQHPAAEEVSPHPVTPPETSDAPPCISVDVMCDARVVSVGQVTLDCRRVVLALRDKKHTLRVPLGGHIALGIPVANSSEIERSYSPVEVAPGRIELLVKRYPHGKGSGYVHSLKPGAIVRIRGPIAPLADVETTLHVLRLSPGDAAMTPPHRVLLLGGGTGVTALLGIARHLLDRPPADNPPLVVVVSMSFRLREDTLLMPQFRALSLAYPGRIALHVHYTREIQPAPTDEYHEYLGRLNGGILAEMAGATPWRDAADVAVVCGPASFNSGMTEFLNGAGLTPQSICVLE